MLILCVSTYTRPPHRAEPSHSYLSIQSVWFFRPNKYSKMLTWRNFHFYSFNNKSAMRWKPNEQIKKIESRRNQRIKKKVENLIKFQFKIVFVECIRFSGAINHNLVWRRHTCCSMLMSLPLQPHEKWTAIVPHRNRNLTSPTSLFDGATASTWTVCQHRRMPIHLLQQT